MSKENESTEEAIQDTSEVKELSTGQRLFPDLLHKEKEIPDEVIVKETKGVVPKKTEEPVEPEAKTEEPPATETKTEERKYLSLKELDGIFIKTKVDGEEQDVAAKDVLRSYQTDKYLTQKGQQLATQFKQLEAAKDSLIAQPKPEVIAGVAEDGLDTDYTEPIDPRVATLTKQVAALTSSLSNMSATLAPTVHEQDMKNVDTYLKTIGHNDFMEYRKEIEGYWLTLPIEQQAALTANDAVNKYKDLKMAKMAKTIEDSSVQKPVEERKAPTVININSGSGPPTGADVDTYETKYAQTLQRCQDTGNFAPLLQLKGLIK